MSCDFKVVQNKDKYSIFGKQNEPIELDLDNFINLYNQMTDLLIENYNRNDSVICVIPNSYYITKEYERLPKCAFALLTKDKVEELHNYMIKTLFKEQSYDI